MYEYCEMTEVGEWRHANAASNGFRNDMARRYPSSPGMRDYAVTGRISALQWLVIGLAWVGVAHAQVSFQSRLGDPTTGLQPLQVSVYDAATNGTPLWGPKAFSNVPVVQGYFNIVLPAEDDGAPPRKLGVIGAGAAYVEVVANGVTNTARQQILAVPRSLDGVPAGAILPFGGQTNAIPAGWLLCDGGEVSRTRYAALYAAVSNAWGTGNGTTTFHIPDLRGQFLRGVDHGARLDPDAGTRTNRLTGAVQAGVGGVQHAVLGSHSHETSFPVQHSDNGDGANYMLINCASVASYQSKVSNEVGGKETRPVNAAVNFIIKY